MRPNVFVRAMASLLMVFAVTATIHAQQICFDGQCLYFPATQSIDVDAYLAQKLATAQKAGPASRAAVRVTAGNSCGSGSVCGFYRDGSLILTNAHVVGTRVGRQVNIRAEVDGRTQEFTGQVIQAAYSDSDLTDWAVVYAEGFKSIEPVLLSKEKPTGAHYTRGSPRCVWPQTGTPVITADIADNSTLWRWRPNSIGGQSGSGVWSVEDDLQYGLLTWSWGGLGAGQQTSEIYRQARERTTKGAPRPAGLRPVIEPDVVCEAGFFSQSDIVDLPIWAGEGNDGGDDDDGTGGGDDDCDCGSDDERRLFQRLRNRAREKNIDFVALLKIILTLIEMFQGQ